MFTTPLRAAALCALAAFSFSSCFGIIDKDRRKIAMFDGKAITRGDFNKVLRDMSPETRPNIRTKGDVRSALQNYLDKRVRHKNAEDLVATGRISIPRQMAEAVLRINKPEMFFKIENPEEYHMTEQDLKYMEEEREIRIDEMLKELEAEEGVLFRIDQAIKEQTIAVTDDEFQKEFELRKADLKHPERIAFSGVLIPGDSQEARAASAEATRKLRGGSPVQDVLNEYASAKAELIEAELEKDPTKVKFAPFWQQASGAQVNDVVGPIFIQGWTQATQDAKGTTSQREYPAGMLTIKVTGRTDETQQTLEEAKPRLQRSILYGKVMDQLRTENGVQIFEDNLDDPGMFDQRQ
ncbi:MAG: peptidyl-prolyl cis-trans isomerase [Candidatus Hydrogenedentes bacterium]|nr:peptidyl-prolyl cis-trans isomerase [Candidatus Hydrogenedentota bacterium]